MYFFIFFYINGKKRINDMEIFFMMITKYKHFLNFYKIYMKDKIFFLIFIVIKYYIIKKIRLCVI